MPLYEYRCESCGHTFEVIQRFSDPAVETCPVCGGVVQKVLSPPAIQFKGSGWYITDYAKKNAPSESRSNGSSSTPPAAAGSKSETKASDASSSPGSASDSKGKTT
jgi:putative FmdB family regulatory protein